MRAISPWCRTRTWRTPNPRRTVSAASISPSRGAETGVPTGTRLAKQAAAGLSQTGRPRPRASARTSALPQPASTRGLRTPPSAAARSPGR